MADILISMNKTTDRLWKYADEWEKTPEHFDGVNPFCVAIHAVRQTTNAPETLKEEAVKPVVNVDEWVCGNCGTWLERQRMIHPSAILHDLCDYCPRCGKKVDWEVVEQDGC